MDVGDWLRGLGLGQYEALFRENDIDAEVLPELTDADLEKLGVLVRPPQAPAQGDRQSGSRPSRGEAAGAPRALERPRTPPSAASSP